MPVIRTGYLSAPPVSTFRAGRSDTISLKAAFPNSPLYNGEYNDEKIRAAFFAPPELSADGFMNDQSYAFGSVSRYYGGAPDLSQVVPGGKGAPGSPYGPNINSPTVGHNPTSIPEDTVATEAARSHSEGAFVGGGADGIVSPSKTTRSIVARTLGGTLTNGNGSGDSYRKRII